MQSDIPQPRLEGVWTTEGKRKERRVKSPWAEAAHGRLRYMESFVLWRTRCVLHHTSAHLVRHWAPILALLTSDTTTPADHLQDPTMRSKSEPVKTIYLLYINHIYSIYKSLLFILPPTRKRKVNGWSTTSCPLSQLGSTPTPENILP